MRSDCTHWQCDRCKELVTVPFGAFPGGWWWEIKARTLSELERSTNRPLRERDITLCSECVTGIERWIRNDPPQVIVHIDESNRLAQRVTAVVTAE